MLILSRKEQTSIAIGDGIRIWVLKIKGNRVSIGIDAAPEVKAIRGELKPREQSNGDGK